MKKICLALLCIFALSSCTSKKAQTEIKTDMKTDCTVRAQKYFNSKPSRKRFSKKFLEKQDAFISSMMQKIAPEVQSCYQKAVDLGLRESFPVCFVTGYNKKGKVEFFEFSTQKKIMVGDLGACLNKIKSNPHLQKAKLKNVSIYQPFNMYLP